MQVKLDETIFSEKVSIEKSCDATIIKIGAGFTIKIKYLTDFNFDYSGKGSDPTAILWTPRTCSII